MTHIERKTYRASTSTGVPLRVRFVGREWRGERLGDDDTVMWSINGATADEAQERIRRQFREPSIVWTVERAPTVLGA